jgi:hypothetical protein
MICDRCGNPEYYGELYWLDGSPMCRDCYRHKYEAKHNRPYRWNDLDGKRPTMEEYQAQCINDTNEKMHHNDQQIIDKFIEESRMYGFTIAKNTTGNGYVCTTRCNRCNKIIVTSIDIQLVDINHERKYNVHYHYTVVNVRR